MAQDQVELERLEKEKAWKAEKIAQAQAAQAREAEKIALDQAAQERQQKEQLIAQLKTLGIEPKIDG